jgi:heat shock 70kDa protein 4
MIYQILQIGPFHPSKGEKAKLKVKVRLNIHGIVTVDSAMVILHI